MINSLRNILKINQLDEMYLVGIFDKEDKEFIVNSNYLYIQLGDKFIELEAIESYSKLKLSITDCICYKNYIEDEIDGKIKISEVVLLNPLEENRKVEEVFFCNLEIGEDILITDILFLKLSNRENVFIDPGFLGINIGGLEQKKLWEENLTSKDKIEIRSIKIE
ncbi:hypothetical protein [Anaerosporobacter sp.]|uniref:hypothetical protein n=1 Tax=Anaerosporobacter sp. TaxID=1872529 RepID=UPI00286F7340|nr:hypothetical protein [Anaerosporobacter sp.]